MPKYHLEDLMAGNARYVAGKPVGQMATARRAELAASQAPFATILSCSDSRVPVETVFDHGPGDIFVIRVAGNFVNDDGLASIEFAVAELKSPLVMVLGHTGCGALAAAIAALGGATFRGKIGLLADAVMPAAQATRDAGADWHAAAVERNVLDNVKALTERSDILATAQRDGMLLTVGAVYDLHTGTVKLLT